MRSNKNNDDLRKFVILGKETCQLVPAFGPCMNVEAVNGKYEGDSKH